MAIDSRLRWLIDEHGQPTAASEDATAMVRGEAPSETTAPGVVDVLVRAAPGAPRDRFAREVERYARVLHSVVGTPGRLIATATVTLDALAPLDASPLVMRIEASRDLQPELTVSLTECGAAAVHALVPPVRGAGALVGVIDSGIDATHPVFRRANGTTRIAALWDQHGTPIAGQSVTYGRVYTSADIDAALGAGHGAPEDPNGHGTHVASIGAGAQPRDGVAPEADLLVVSYASDGLTLGRSMNALDAFQWIVDEARARAKPVAINMSQGMNGGSHAGASMLEVAMDSHCRAPGVVLVKSAGNEQEWRTHASGTVAPGQPVVLEIECRATKRSPGLLEIWHDQRDDLEVRVRPPSGAATPWVSKANAPQTFTLAGTNVVRIDSELDAETIGDDLINVFFAAGGSGVGLTPGTWRVEIRSAALGADGRIDAWLERTGRNPPSEQLRFSAASADATCTISTPGTARRVITVGSYVTTPDPPGSALVGALSGFSSRGPTRHRLRKPDLSAPGEWIDAARSAQAAGNGDWVRMPGTSMAAPHVAGAAALLLADRPDLTGEEIRQLLAASARPWPASPDDLGGHGRLDVDAALQLLRSGSVGFPTVVGTRILGTRFEIDTAAQSTASLLYDANPRRVLAGRRTGSLASLAPATTHVFDLQAAGPGTWHFEVHLFDGPWRTIADDGGPAWSITVP